MILYPEALESRLPPPRRVVPGSAGVRGSGRCCRPRGAAAQPGQLFRGEGGLEREKRGQGKVIRQIPRAAGQAGVAPRQVMLSARGTSETPDEGRGSGRPRLRPVVSLSLSLSPSGFVGGTSGLFPTPRGPLSSARLPGRASGRLQAAGVRRDGPAASAVPASYPRGRPLLLLPLRWGKPPRTPAAGPCPPWRLRAPTLSQAALLGLGRLFVPLPSVRGFSRDG